ncbi:MAG: DUF4097 domain-containing protein [Pyrinomonadaceae bacterium]
MKFFVLPIVLLISLTAVAPAFGKKDRKPSGKVERSTPADPHVVITVCVKSGEITVRGWDKAEVRASSADADEIEFRRIDKVKHKDQIALPPATRIDLMIVEKSDERSEQADCQSMADIELNVPLGATVQAQTRDGDIHIEGVAAAYAGSQNGDIYIERAATLVEAGSVGGSISLKDSSGRINLSSAGGGVQASNIRSADGDDSFEVGTVSGDIELEHVNSTNVTAKTVNGNVTMTGPLAHSGRYSFTNLSGNVVLALPADASFQLNAKLAKERDIISEFTLKPITQRTVPPAPPTEGTPQPEGGLRTAPLPPTTPAPKTGPVVAPVVVKPQIRMAYMLHRVNAICGSGDAMISVASFGGALRLKKL